MFVYNKEMLNVFFVFFIMKKILITNEQQMLTEQSKIKSKYTTSHDTTKKDINYTKKNIVMISKKNGEKGKGK